MALCEAPQYLFVRSGRGLLLAFVTQIDTKVAFGGAMVRIEIRCRYSHGVFVSNLDVARPSGTGKYKKHRGVHDPPGAVVCPGIKLQPILAIPYEI